MPNDTTTAAPPKRVPALVEVRNSLTQMEPEFRAALPAHIPSAKFVRTAQTAIAMNPSILECDRRSLYAACMKAAQDGLVLDGREAALVKFGGDAQYMPMVAGILKKARNSGDISTIAAHVAYERDLFDYTLGDDEKITHKPFLGEGGRGKPVVVYAVAKLKDGGIMREIMSVAEVERVRAVSRSKDKGPWVQWWDEMAKKTVIRRLAKRLPSSTDREDDEFQRTVERDDDLYALDETPAQGAAPATDTAAPPRQRRTRASQVIDAKANEPPPAPPADPVRQDNGPPEPPPPHGSDDYGDIPPHLDRRPKTPAPSGDLI